MANIREAIEGHIECLLTEGEPIPADDIEQEDLSPAIFDAKLRVKA